MSFGASVSDMQVALADDCTTIALREVDVAIPGIARQEQIDCRGFDYFGAPRLAEFVFGDGRLMIAWILVETPELDALEAAFTAQYGAPTHKTPMLAAYADDQAVVRRDTPEAGFYAPALDAPYRGFFDAQVAAASE
ncbi:MAG: hypothetical protein GC152_02215 [Alphaproteobacteria bacterium]|nr:hypothetical protein [Alphaproteobacteria bacterium]